MRFILNDDKILANCIDFISKIDTEGKKKKAVIITDAESARTLAQNRLYWKWLEFLSNETGYTREEFHDFFKVKFLSEKITIFGEYIISIKSTTKLGVVKFKEYLESIENWVFNNMGYIFPATDDYKEALK